MSGKEKRRSKYLEGKKKKKKKKKPIMNCKKTAQCLWKIKHRKN